METRNWIAGLFDRSFDPALARRLPRLDARSQSSIPGLYMVGEIAGTPLIKLGLNAGVDVVDRLQKELGDSRQGIPEAGGPSGASGDSLTDKTRTANDVDIDGRRGRRPLRGSGSESVIHDGLLDVLIVGAGSSGLGAADRCAQLGLRYLVIEQQRTAQLIRNFTKGKPLFAEPNDVELKTRIWFEECSKEVLLAKWDRQVPELGLKINEFEQVTDIQRRPDGDGFVVTTDKGEYAARRVVLAIGMAGNPRKLGVAGETDHADRISQNVADPDEWSDRDLVVFGAGDVACEAAVVLADRGNRVTMAAPDKELTFPKKRNIDAVAQRAKAGRITLLLSHKAGEIRDGELDLVHTGTNETTTIKNDHIFRCIGADLPLKFFDRVGIKLEGTWDRRRWIMLAASFAIVFTLYAIKKPAFPFGGGHPLGFVPAAVTVWTPAVVEQAVKIDPVFWYAFLYSLVMTYFGLKAYRRWGVQYNDAYQKKRFACLIAVQWTLGFVIPAGIMYWVHHKVGDNLWLGKADNYWHAFGIELAFPLYFPMFFYDVGLFYLIYGLIATFVVIPVLSVFHGKRYCTWVCGCGGLAETLGDRWRHLAPKGKVSVRWEWMSTAVMIWAFGAAGFVIARLGFGVYAGSEAFDKHGLAAGLIDSYGWVTDFWLAAVIPVTLYPFFGGKIWCRYWCPLAKWMQLWSKWLGRLRIVSDDKCISCGECSRYCQIGIDVMSFAKNGQEFSNKNTSCIHCGICVTVCPMDVLSFDSNGNNPRATASSSAECQRGGESHRG